MKVQKRECKVHSVYSKKFQIILIVFIKERVWEGAIFGELMVKLFPVLMEDITLQLYYPNKS